MCFEWVEKVILRWRILSNLIDKLIDFYEKAFYFSYATNVSNA